MSDKNKCIGPVVEYGQKDNVKWDILKLNKEVYNDIYQKGYDAKIDDKNKKLRDEDREYRKLQVEHMELQAKAMKVSTEANRLSIVHMTVTAIAQIAIAIAIALLV